MYNNGDSLGNMLRRKVVRSFMNDKEQHIIWKGGLEKYSALLVYFLTVILVPNDLTRCYLFSALTGSMVSLISILEQFSVYWIYEIT